jgi:hypothetical protein
MRINVLCIAILLSVVLPAASCGYGSNYKGGTMMPGSAPKLTELVPNDTPAGSAGFTLTDNGTGFGTSTAVFWNGSALATSYVTGNQITATVTAADVAASGNIPVYVRSGTTNSNMLTFTVQ